jgi:hypothetical protein
MADDSENDIRPAKRVELREAGDIPTRLMKYYVLDESDRSNIGFHRPGDFKTPTFRDQGQQLTATRIDPNTVRDMIAIAEFRGWKVVSVRGAPDFRREAWISAMAAGLNVRGHRPTLRDVQDVAYRVEAQARRPRQRSQNPAPVSTARLVKTERGVRMLSRTVDTVVRARVSDPYAQNRILAAARDRLIVWLERGAHVVGLADPERRAGWRER